eukprot:12442485-Heterocapsa_arctica.AAC.1
MRVAEQHSLAEGNEVGLVPVAGGIAKRRVPVLLDVESLDDPASMSDQPRPNAVLGLDRES